MSIRIAVTTDESDCLDEVAREIAALVEGWGDRVDVTVNPSAPKQGGDPEKIIDPISVAALILSLPGAVLAAMDLTDRVVKRRRAKQLIDAAKRLSADGHAELWVVGPSGPTVLSRITPDEVMELSGGDDN